MLIKNDYLRLTFAMYSLDYNFYICTHKQPIYITCRYNTNHTNRHTQAPSLGCLRFGLKIDPILKPGMGPSPCLYKCLKWQSQPFRKGLKGSHACLRSNLGLNNKFNLKFDICS